MPLINTIDGPQLAMPEPASGTISCVTVINSLDEGGHPNSGNSKVYVTVYVPGSELPIINSLPDTIAGFEPNGAFVTDQLPEPASTISVERSKVSKSLHSADAGG